MSAPLPHLWNQIWKISSDKSNMPMVSFTNANISDTIMEKECSAQPVCDPNQKYRRIDGSCNNLSIPKLGMAFTPLRRVLPNAYEDGESNPYTSIYFYGLNEHNQLELFFEGFYHDQL